MEDQLEEGEIIDDDDEVVYNFEDISDDSIIDIPNRNGKFVSSNERLRALSLSSVSDTDITAIDNCNKNRKYRKKSSNKHCKRHTSRRQYHQYLLDTNTDTDADSDVYYQDHDLKDKLKEAIRISDDDVGIIRRCSNLQTRLKLNHQFGGCDPISDQKQRICDNLDDDNNNNNRISEDDDIENLRLQALKTTEYNKYEKQDSNGDNLSDRNDKIDDSELENLRLEALKTAVLNKFQKRKRRKALQENQIKNNQSDNYKENESDKNLGKEIEENLVEKSCNNNDNQQNQLTDLDEDEDVLRASLLANLAKKIKTTSDELNIIPQPQTIVNIPQKITNHRLISFKSVTKIPDPSKLVVNNLTKKEPQRRILPIKPLIINLKDDSDSDDDFENLPKTTISDTTNTKPLDDLVEKFLKEQRAKVETQQILKNQSIKPQIQKQFQLQQIKRTTLVRNNNNNNNSTNIMEKSAMKLLPKSAQLEYQELLKRLKTAEIKQKILKRKNLDRLEKTAMAMKTTKSEEIPKKNEDIEKINEKHSNETNRQLTALQKTLKEIRIQKNGSLQIKNKYQDLTPIMRKINEARNERKKYENLIKQLLNDLNEARNNLWKSHEKFSIHVKELIDRKAMIDKSVGAINKRNVKINNNSIKNSVEITKQTTIEETIEMKPIVEETPPICNDKNDSCEDMEICTNDDELEQLHIDIVDPNDIDEIYKKQPIKPCIPEYISPLTNYERYNNVDPYGIMCPYEVNGSCRDSECGFKHFLKIQDNAG